MNAVCIVTEDLNGYDVLHSGSADMAAVAVAVLSVALACGVDLQSVLSNLELELQEPEVVPEPIVIA